MNADGFLDLRRLIREELATLRLAELAVVQDIHPHAGDGDDDNFACTVRLRDTGLVLARVPVATARRGLASIPDVGDLVLVQFIGGDVNAPVITGSLYNDQDRPPPNAEGELVLALPAGAGEGEGLRLRLASAAETSARLDLGGALSVALQDDDPVVRIDVGDGAATLTIESDGSLSIASSRGVAIRGGEITLEGSAISLEADGAITLKGATINLN